MLALEKSFLCGSIPQLVTPFRRGAVDYDAYARLVESQVRNGSHVGEVTYGNVGGHDRLDFTVIGPAVNLATRIERLCKTSGSRVLVSSEFRAALNGDLPDPVVSETGPVPRFRSIGAHRFPGIAADQTVFALT